MAPTSLRMKRKYIPNLVLFPVFMVAMLTSVSCSKCPPEDQQAAGSGIAATSLNLKSAHIFVTAENTNLRITEGDALMFGDFGQPEEHFATIMLDPAKTFQTIEGIGGALTDAAAETFYKLPAAKQEEILTAYFDKEKGIGYSLCRTHINSCDFSSESYAYSEVEGDTALDHFSISHDLKYRIPFTKSAMAKAGNEIKLLASPWSPPAWMKTNNDMLHGGQLKPEYAGTWAEYYVKFIREYQKQGIPIWALTVQNEAMAVQTWESCIYSAAEERDFVKNNLGPAMEKAGMRDVKLLIWDHNRGIMFQRAQCVLDDPEASKYVWGTAFHWYTGNHFDNVKLVNEAYPDKKTLFTEGCIYPFDYSKLNEWQWGEEYGRSVINDINNGAVGWIDWNVLLDEKGGPNHVGNFCYAPVIGNIKTGEVIYMNSFYYLGHFSKFFRPGARRIICSSNHDDLQAAAVLNPDGSVALVVMNATANEIPFKVWIRNRAVSAMSLAHSIATITIR
jgi:glucosylceramidase